MKRLVCVIAISCLMQCLTGCGTPASTEPEKEYSMETIREEVYGVDSLVKLADGTEVTAIRMSHVCTYTEKTNLSVLCIMPTIRNSL